jgi:opacity protein-like surface antigen
MIIGDEPGDGPRSSNMMKKIVCIWSACFVLGAAGYAAEAAKRPLLQLRLSGSLGRLASGDFAEDIKSHDQLYKDLAGLDSGGTLSGGHSPTSLGLGGGADFLFALSDRVSLGLGFEWLSKNTTDSQNLRIDFDEKSFQSMERSIQHKLGLTGFLLKLNYRLPLSRTVSLFADVGAGLYITDVDHDISWTGSYEFWGIGRYVDTAGVRQNGWFKYLYGQWTQSDLTTLSKSKIGWTGGLGIEFFVSKAISLFLEGKARLLTLEAPDADESFDFHETWQEAAILADLRSLKSSETRETWDKQGPLSLYDYTSAATKKTYAFITANAEKLEAVADNSNFRSAVINLNGLEVRLGVNIRLF